MRGTTLSEKLNKHDPSSQGGDTIAFKQLLHELLPDQDERQNAELDDNYDYEDGQFDFVPVNFKIIQVMLQGGVMPLIADNHTFEKKEKLIKQAQDSLFVVRLSMRRTPDVLVIEATDLPKDSTDGNMDCARLYLWLLPRLLSLLAEEKLEALHTSIMLTLERLFYCMTLTPLGWSHCDIVVRYVRDCVECILTSFKTSIKTTMTTSYAISIPSIEFDTDLADRGIAVRPPGSLHFPINTSSQAAVLMVKLFTVLMSAQVYIKRIPNSGVLMEEALRVLATIAELLNQVDIWNNFPRHAPSAKSLLRQLLGSLVHVLEACQGEHPIIMLFALRYACLFMTKPFVDVDQDTEVTLASIILLVIRHSAYNTMTELHIVDMLHPCAVKLIQEEEKWNLLHCDLKMALLRVLLYVQTSDNVQQAIRVRSLKELQSLNQGQWVYQDEKLQQYDDSLLAFNFYDKVELKKVDAIERKDRSKRRKVLHDDEPKSARAQSPDELISRVYKALGNQSVTDLGGLSTIAVTGYTQLTNPDKLVVLEDLGMLPCVLTDTVSYMTEPSVSDKISPFCTVCDGKLDRHQHKNVMKVADASELLKTLDILRSHIKSTRCRVQMMLSLRRIVNHLDESDTVLTNTSLIQWCLQSLHSTARELRMTAAHTLPCLPSFALGHESMKADRFTCLNYVRDLSSHDDDVVQETCVIVWSQMACVLEDDEQALALIRLIDYFGHKSSFIVALAYNEFTNVITTKQCTPRKLLTPFWREIMVHVVGKLVVKPQVAKMVSELLETDELSFMSQVVPHILPFMILGKKFDVINKIDMIMKRSVDYRGMSKLCLDHIGAILGVLLVQGYPDPEKHIMQLLTKVSEGLKVVDLGFIMRSNPMIITAAVLKCSTGDDNGETSKVMAALQLIANLVQQKRNAPQKKERDVLLPIFIEANVLGLMTDFSETIYDVFGQQPVSEKHRTLRGIEHMVKFGKFGVSGALPQICACLQSALLHPKLRSVAFQAWSSLLLYLPGEDVQTILGTTFSLILKYWDTLSPSAQDNITKMMSRLFETNMSSIKETAGSLPSLKRIDALMEYEEKFYKWKTKDDREYFRSLALRCSHENGIVVEIALIELSEYLKEHETYVQTAASDEMPDPVVAEVVRLLLDTVVKYNHNRPDIADLCSICLGSIGAIDTNRIDFQRPSNEFIMLQNFDAQEEDVAFAIYLLEERLVKSFHSATDTKSQGFLAHAMQELLKYCAIDNFVLLRPSVESAMNEKQNRWNNFSENAKTTLAPFLSSRFRLSLTAKNDKYTYPITKPGLTYRQWITRFILDLFDKATGQRAQAFAEICSRVIKGQDVAIANFLLPHICLHILISGTEDDRNNIITELLTVLESKDQDGESYNRDILRQCYESIFLLMDHLSRWTHERKKLLAQARIQLARQNNRHLTEDFDEAGDQAVANVEKVITAMPARLMGERSLECKSYARALFYWEQYLRKNQDTLKENGQEKPKDKNQSKDNTNANTEESANENLQETVPHDPQESGKNDAQAIAKMDEEKDVKEDTKEDIYRRLQKIYAELEEPDGIEGMSAKLPVLNSDQQILEHKKAGHWLAVQSWYEHLLQDKPQDHTLQLELLSSLKESGQYENLLNNLDQMLSQTTAYHAKIPIFAVEAAWMSSKWDKLQYYVDMYPETRAGLSFDIDVGRAIIAFRIDDDEGFKYAVTRARESVNKMLSISNTRSFRQCRENLFQLHALAEMEMMHNTLRNSEVKLDSIVNTLDARLKVIEPSLKERQYLLALRRAFYTSFYEKNEKNVQVPHVLSTSWLLTSKMARKAGDFHHSFNAILNATKLKNPLAAVEQARLFWTEGHHRKAIQALESAIKSGAFDTLTTAVSASLQGLDNSSEAQPQSHAKAQAMLLWAKWLDMAGQSHSSELINKYRSASQNMVKWEKGHYYLGRHYNKIYETEKSLPPNKRTQSFLNGENAKLICQNYLRALSYGTKYIFQTLPRVLTLWLDLGAQAESPLDVQYGSEEFRNHVAKERMKQIDALNNTVSKYCLQRIPAYVYLTAFPQIMSRICHPSEKIWIILRAVIVRVVLTFPQHGLWSLMAVYKSTQHDRRQRGIKILEKLKESSKTQNIMDLRTLVNSSQKLVAELLTLCNAELVGKPTHVSLQEHLRFNHSVAPIPLVVPLQAQLTPSFPPGNIVTKSHNPFARDLATIHRFEDDADVMNSLQKPRKIMILGTDGKHYPFLCKPKDDLRKDARLMEFNTIINRLLKKDIEASKRQLAIRTYAVTPLNEECGLIEWVNNVRPLRDILLKNYRAKNIPINYNEIRMLLDNACASPHANIFEDELLPKFPPVFHEWFIEMFAEPAKWMTSRLAFARTSAVMSMVGFVLGLGDRHGENILFDETNGETLHVDFNCLFDKGLTFEKPERVPFRLTQNMVDALGVTGYEGPFRRSSEIVMKILRQNEDSLMTVLEAFLHDPLVEWMQTKKRRSTNANKVPDNPKDVLEVIRNKLRGLHTGEPVALSVEGQVQELIRQAVSAENLAQMYIGWCAFF